MKVVLCLLVLVVAAYSAPKTLTDVEKRADRQLGSSGLYMKSIFCEAKALGGDTEAECVNICRALPVGDPQGDDFLHSHCPLICNSLMAQAHLISCY